MTTVLVIDDDIVTRAAIEDYLAEAGYDVIEAENGIEGLRAFELNTPDIVLLDVSMPGMDGYDVCRHLRNSPLGCHVPIVMMTGHDDAASVNRSYESGATDFSTKPLNLPILVHRLRYLLRAKQTSDQLRVSETSLAQAQRIARLGNWEYEFATRDFVCSSQARVLFGLPDQGGVTLDDVLNTLSGADRDLAIDEFMQAYRNEGQPYDVDFRLLKADGAVFHIHQETDFERDKSGTLLKAMGTFQDVTEIREAESRIRQIAFFDNVTGLPNRTFFMERLSEMLSAARRHSKSMALMFVDLDQFKRVNDSWGHLAGDELLREVSNRLRETLRSCDVVSRLGEHGNETLARLGGDEFVVLIPQIRHPEDAARVARRLLKEFKQPFVIEGTEIFVSASIGISTFPLDGTDEQALLKNADVAMYQVKENGRNGYRFYSPTMNTRSIERLNMETSLWHALKNNQFVLNYQPKIHLATRTIIGAEALVRLEHPDLGLVSPGDFIPIAEECGLIVPLGKWVLEEACRQAAIWQRDICHDWQVSVNISAAQFQREELANTIAGALSASGLKPSLLEAELTESTLMKDTESHIEVLKQLREMDIEVSIDDFGTGYSSLSYLKRLPIDCLKIDRSFIRDMTSDKRDAAIVRSTIALAHNLDLKLVAEGVENANQNAMLAEFGCDAVQGYFYAPAMSAGDFVAWATAFDTPQLRSAR